MTPEQQGAVDAAVTALREHRPVDTTTLPTAVAQLFEGFQEPSSRFVDSDDAVYPPDAAAALRPGTKDQGPRTKDQGPRTKDQGPGTRDQGPKCC